MYYRNSIKWTVLEKIVVYSFQFIALAVLARYLTPEDFSQIAMIMIVVAIGQTLVDSGLSASLIRKNKVSEIDYSTVRWFSLILGATFWLGVFLASDKIESFYLSPGLSLVVSLMSLSFVIDSFSISAKSKLMKEFRTKEIFNATMISSIIGSAVAILLALNNMGVYSIIFQTLVQRLVFSIFICSNERFGNSFSIKLLMEHISFSSKILLSGLISVVFKNSYYLIIGKLYDDYIVGFFFQAKKVADIIPNIVTDIVSRSTLPYLSSTLKVGDSNFYVGFYQAYNIICFISSSILLFLSVFSSDLIYLLLGDQWSNSVEYVNYLIIGVAFNPVNILILNALQALGRSDVFLGLEIIKKINFLIMLFISVPNGVLGLCLGAVYVSISGLILNIIFLGFYSNTSSIRLFYISILLFFAPLVVNIAFNYFSFGLYGKVAIFTLFISIVAISFYFLDRKSFSLLLTYILRR